VWQQVGRAVAIADRTGVLAGLRIRCHSGDPGEPAAEQPEDGSADRHGREGSVDVHPQFLRGEGGARVERQARRCLVAGRFSDLLIEYLVRSGRRLGRLPAVGLGVEAALSQYWQGERAYRFLAAGKFDGACDECDEVGVVFGRSQTLRAADWRPRGAGRLGGDCFLLVTDRRPGSCSAALLTL